MVKWDKDNPLHREIMEAGKEAFINRHLAEYREEYERIVARLPWWARVYMKVYSFIGGLRWRVGKKK